MSRLWDKTEVGAYADDSPIRMVVSGLTDENIWLTSLKGSVEPNYQIMYSIGADAYINSFNQRLSVWTITGIYIPKLCSGGSRKPGFVSLYNSKNITKTKATKITFDGITITGYIIRLTINDVMKQGIDGHIFSLDFLGRLGGGRSTNGGGGALGGQINLGGVPSDLGGATFG